MFNTTDTPGGHRPALAFDWFRPGVTAHGVALFRAVLALGAWVAFGQPAVVKAAETLVTLRTRHAVLGVGDRGQWTTFAAVDGGRNYLAAGQPAPVLSVRVGGRMAAPDSASWDGKTGRLTLGYASVGVTAVLSVVSKPTHVVLEVQEVRPVDRVELVVWGPYPTTVGDIIGETVGVVRDKDVALGIQSLHPKTLGGFPGRDDDQESGYGADDNGSYAEFRPELTRGQSFRGETARGTAFGSVLQAYCRDRGRGRIIANWGHEKYEAPAFPDGGVVGSRIALFACPASQALDVLGTIEVAEGLPHPMLDGVWGKKAPGASASYLIVDFGEATVDRAIEMTRRAGLKYLYHSSPFATWGHFKLKADLFPRGWDGLRACVEAGRKAGVRIGFHTLSNFITPTDSYVTPRPDPRLARIGASELADGVNAVQREISIAAPDYFVKATTLNTVMVGDELIRYGAVSGQAPWRLLNCERGAWGTRASAHGRGAVVARLMDHGYGVFLGDASLSLEMAGNIAALFNRSGALQVSFDGLEGNWASALGQYGSTLFTKSWYDALAPELQGRVINDASNPGHYNWHIYTRMNWGEPWYAGFRESQTLYRFKNQVYFERNLMPRMLGWFALRPDTSVEDAEWLLARAAGFGAGFTLATSLASTAQLEADPESAEARKRFGAVTSILELIRHWETARMTGAFPGEIREALRDNAREFHLQPAGEAAWDLFEAHTARFAATPGQSAAHEFQFVNPAGRQPLQWTVRSSGKEPVTRLAVDVNGVRVMDLKDTPIPAGGSVKYTGGSEAVIADGAWKEVARIPVDARMATVASGGNRISVAGGGQPGAALKLEIRTLGNGTRLRSGAAAPALSGSAP